VPAHHATSASALREIRNTRASEISAANAAWDQAGNSVYVITFTAPHDMGVPVTIEP